MGCEGALDVLDGFSLLVDHTGDWDIEDIDRVDDGAVEDIDFEFLGLHVGRRRLRGVCAPVGQRRWRFRCWHRSQGDRGRRVLRRRLKCDRGFVEGGDAQDDGEGQAEEKGDVFHGVVVC